MATPMNDDNVEKLLEPFRTAVKLQVRNEKKFNLNFEWSFFRVILLNNSKIIMLTKMMPILNKLSTNLNYEKKHLKIK